jgi:serine protease SohB
MVEALFQILLFSAKSLIAVIFILILFAGILALLSRGKQKMKGKICIKNLNKKWTETTEELLQEILPKKNFKQFLKQTKNQQKKQNEIDPQTQKNIFVINFEGDIKGSAVASLREEVTAILNIASPKDEVVIRLESPGGMVHAYGLAAAQLYRIREKNIPLTVTVDKVAASGGYMMACIANKILAAPFSIIGSIGVIMQLPNFNRWLKEKNIDFEQITAGQYKRTLTLFGHNTEEGREKMREEIEDIHTLFKNLIHEYRPQLNIEQVATGEHWLGSQALELKLVDDLTTSDDYLLEQSKTSPIYEICYVTKKSLGAKLSSAVHSFKNDTFGLM